MLANFPPLSMFHFHIFGGVYSVGLVIRGSIRSSVVNYVSRLCVSSVAQKEVDHAHFFATNPMAVFDFVILCKMSSAFWL